MIKFVSAGLVILVCCSVAMTADSNSACAEGFFYDLPAYDSGKKSSQTTALFDVIVHF